MRTPLPHHFVQSDHCDHGPGSLDAVRSISIGRIGSTNTVNARTVVASLKLVERLTQKEGIIPSSHSATHYVYITVVYMVYVAPSCS